MTNPTPSPERIPVDMYAQRWPEGQYAILRIQEGPSTHWPIAQRDSGAWQCGKYRWRDEQVSEVMPLTLVSPDEVEALRAERDSQAAAVRALSGLTRRVWNHWRTTALRPEHAKVAEVVDRLPDDQAVALNASLGRAYGTRPGLSWDGGHPVARAIYEADPASEGEPYDAPGVKP